MAEDIYLKLLNDLVPIQDDSQGTPFSVESDLFDDTSQKTYALAVGNIWNKLKGQNDEIDIAALKKELFDSEKIVEPCPIMYTGNPEKELNGEKFHFRTIIVALNPHEEKPRPINNIKTWGDLAHYHHPYHNAIPNYTPEYDTTKNNYWRVFGHMETRIKWSPFYKYVFCLHMTLCMDKGNDEKFNTWENVKKTYINEINKQREHENKTIKKTITTDELSELIIRDLNQNYPIANLEMIPFKSRAWKIDDKKVNNLFSENNDKADDGYIKYLKTMEKFIRDYSSKDTYIILAGGMDTKCYFLEQRFGIKQEEMDCYQIFSCEKDKSVLSPFGKPECYGAAPVYFIKKKLGNAEDSKRKFLILPGISPSNTRYRWLYDDVEKLVKEIKNYFDPK